MKQIEIIVEAENAQEVLEVLKAGDIEYNSVRDLKAIARVKLKAKSSNVEGGCGKGTRKSPSILQKGINFATALTEHIITGKKHVKPDEYMRRLSICKVCTSRLEGFVCAKCGCYMGIKASWAEQKCKINKW